MRDHSVIRIQRNHNGTDEIKKKSKIYVPQEKEQSSRFYINNSYEFEIVRNNFYVYWIKKKKARSTGNSTDAAIACSTFSK
jgi:hypothetical protein